MSHFRNFPGDLPDLVGESVYLRELSEEDIPAWFERASDVEAADLAGDPVPESPDVGLQWLQRHRDAFREKTAVRWAILPAGSAVSVGTVGLSLKPGEECKAELGIVVARALWGKGIGTSAANLVNRYAFTTLGVVEIHAEVLQRNPGSIRLLEKAGFQRLRVIPATASEPEELLQYSLSRPCNSAALPVHRADSCQPLGNTRRSAVVLVNSAGSVSSADDFRSLERARLRSLVERDIELASALHSSSFHLVTPGGITRSRESYLTAVKTGAITYLKWQAGEIMVRQFSDVVLLRYQAELEMPSRSGGTSSFTCWHTDSYELHNGLWQVVFSQATRVV